MYVNLLYAFVAISPALTAVFKEEVYSCSNNEIACGDGACVSVDHMCDGHNDCADGTDEHTCFGLSSQNKSMILSRSRRQAACRKNQWRCRDGTCISFDGKCDGVVDCLDGSDETHALCRKTQCQYNWFRCTYGACVDGTAPCNGVQECADNSDELLPRCRNETDEVKGQFKCGNGETIDAANHCDGVADCADGSDETVRACAGKLCPSYLFQCAYGACVDQGADCNGKQECADNSDESDELCNRMAPTQAPTVTNKPVTSPTVSGGRCILPPQPAHGEYVVDGIPDALPGQRYQAFELNISCTSGYGVVGNNQVSCYNGKWYGTMPQCVSFCKLTPDDSVEYRCLVIGEGDIEPGIRACNTYEPSGTQVRPECRRPNYFSTDNLPLMRCIEGSWNYKAVCKPECGTVTPGGIQLVINGRAAERGELPWHVGIYSKTHTPYMQICGGSLVRTTQVISAAHCFWSDVGKAASPENYAVAAGKIYRPWNYKNDADVQRTDVTDIKMPVRFQGTETNFQDDIALVIVAQAFVYKTYIRPVCVDWSITFEAQQLAVGKLGKVAGWGLTGENGKESPILQVVELPYVDTQQCISQSPPGFREYITSDKICAGFGNGTALCRGDSGGGLAFPADDRGTLRYFLRGIVSTAPKNEDLCNAHVLTTFTQVTKHEIFLQRHLSVF